MTTLTSAGNLLTVDIGTVPNDGTGDNLRKAFNTYNESIITIGNFLNAPTFSTVDVTGSSFIQSLTAGSVAVNSSLSLLGNADSISTTTGALIVSGGVGFGGNANIGGNVNITGDLVTDDIIATTITLSNSLSVPGTSYLTGHVITGDLSVGTTTQVANAEIFGNLTVHGNVTNVTTSNLKVEYPILRIGQLVDTVADGIDAVLTSSDGKDRGVEFYWYDPAASSQQEGFFGFDASTEEFIYIPRSSYVGVGDSDVFAGTPGNARFSRVYANITANGSSTFDTVTVTNGVTGTLITNDQPNITSVGTLTNLHTAGNVTIVNGSIYLDANADVYLGSSTLTALAATFSGGLVPLASTFQSTATSTSSSTGAVKIAGGLGVGENINAAGTIAAPIISGTTLTGTLSTAAQPNITKVGTLGNLTVASSLLAGAGTFTNLTVTTAINTNSITATAGITGTLQTTSQPNITSVGTLTSLAVTGNITAANLIGNVVGASSTVSNPAQPAITSVGTLTSLNVSGNVTAPNFIGALTGNASTATKLQTPRAINGVLFDGSADITVTANASTLSSTTLNSSVIASSLQSVGSLVALNVTGTTTLSGALNSTSSINANTISGEFTGNIGSTTPKTGVFSTVTANGLIYSTANGFKFPDGTIQTTAGVPSTGSINYSTTAGSITGQANSATITASSANIVNQIVQRDASGNFVAGTITANLTGTASNATNSSLAAKASTLAANGGNGTAMTFNWLPQTGQPAALWGGNSVDTTYTYNPSNFYVAHSVLASTANVIVNQANSATITATNANNINQIVLRDVNGNFSAGTITASLAGNASTADTLSANRSNWVEKNVNDAVVGQLSWRNYGDGHTIFDASSGFAPDGTAINALNSVAGWAATYPVLMGWNGSLTYGVRVDSAKLADAVANQKNSATITATSSNTINQIVLRDAAGSFSANIVTANKFSGDGSLLTNVPYTALAGSPSGSLTIGSTNIALGGTTNTLAGLASVTSTSLVGNVTGNVTGHASLDLPLTGGTLTGALTATSFSGSGAGLTGTASSLTAGTAGTANALNPANSYSTQHIAATGTGNDYASGGVELIGDGATNTVFPNIGFHQPGLYASSLQLRGGSDFRFYAQGAASYANVTANIFYGTASQAQYADLAEMYVSDSQYEPGTVLVFGGTKEVTTTETFADVSVAGVVSTAPAYLMNKDQQDAVAVALRGKVPVKVIGAVEKGDLLVTSAIAGYARSVGKDASYPIATFAKALESDASEGTKVIIAVII